MSRKVLMLHGLCGSGSVFTPWISTFEQAGFDCDAPTLQANYRLPASKTPERIRNITIEDYLIEAEWLAVDAARESGLKPIVLGHSTGGLIAQVLLAKGLAAAGVLLAPLPPPGLKPSLAWLARLKLRRAFGWNWSRRTMEVHPEVSARLFGLSGGAQRALLRDSGRFAEACFFPRADGLLEVDPRSISVPMLIIAGRKDRLVRRATIRKLARAYSHVAAYWEVRDHGHWLMSEAVLATHIIAWLGKTLPAPERANRAGGVAA